MGIEIERKFLVTGKPWTEGTRSTIFQQGYLNRNAERTVRVRVAGNKAMLTIKGISKGASRAEFEYEIPVTDAEALLQICEGPVIEKTRYFITFEDKLWEVDEFHGDNDGLIIAEIELESEDEKFVLPPWVKEDVTDDKRYYNSALSILPYSQW